MHLDVNAVLRGCGRLNGLFDTPGALSLTTLSMWPEFGLSFGFRSNLNELQAMEDGSRVVRAGEARA